MTFRIIISQPSKANNTFTNRMVISSKIHLNHYCLPRGIISGLIQKTMPPFKVGPPRDSTRVQQTTTLNQSLA